MVGYHQADEVICKKYCCADCCVVWWCHHSKFCCTVYWYIYTMVYVTSWWLQVKMVNHHHVMLIISSKQKRWVALALKHWQLWEEWEGTKGKRSARWRVFLGKMRNTPHITELLFHVELWVLVNNALSIVWKSMFKLEEWDEYDLNWCDFWFQHALSQCHGGCWSMDVRFSCALKR